MTRPRYLLLIVLMGTCLQACKKEKLPDTGGGNDTSLYFPPIGSTSWENTTPESLGWNTAALPQLYSFLEAGNTRAFIVLKNGRIVLEKYFGTQANGTAFNSSSFW